jgi:hypothetical protein
VCVQHSIDSRNSAIHGAYRILLRPSSLLEPRHPSLKVVIGLKIIKFKKETTTIFVRFTTRHPATAPHKASLPPNDTETV